MIDYRKLFKVSFLITIKLRQGIKDKYINHLSDEELIAIDDIVREILKENSDLIAPNSHPYVGSIQYIKDKSRGSA